jgi:aspartate/methionine/tyrosine aminotransferase
MTARPVALKSSRRGRIPPFIVMDVMRAANARAAEGHSVCHLEVGQPGRGAPRAVLEAAKRALERDLLGYTEALGIPSLRARIAEHYHAWYGQDVNPEHVTVTTGSSAGFMLAFLAAFDPGDRVALAVPAYPAYRNILESLGLEVVCLQADIEHGFQPTVGLLEQVAGRLDGLIVTSPANPTGSMLDRDRLTRLVAYCAERGVRLISDEIYHGITFGNAPVSVVELTPDAVVVNSFSKYFSMTGWRLGWLIVPEDLQRSVECLSQNLYISPPALSQIAAEAVFDCTADLDAQVEVYRRNRDLLLRELPKAGFERFAPADGAFYLYADVGHMTNDSESFCRRMLFEAGVAATPGVDFDRDQGRRFVRFSFSRSEQEVADAAARLIDWRRQCTEADRPA